MGDIHINDFDYSNKNLIYRNKNGYEFKVIDTKTEKLINSRGNPRYLKTYLVHFIVTGFEKWCETKEIKTGGIKDWKAPDVCGVGIVGQEFDHPQSHYLYDRWRDMLRRCYDRNCKLYKSYGACGVTVCDEWKYFPNYVRDIESKENYEKLKGTHKDNVYERYEIDKDIIKQGNKTYCNEYTCIVPFIVNHKERNERNHYNKEINQIKVLQISFEFKLIKIHDCMSDAYREIKNIRTTSGVNMSGICACCKGKQLYALNYFWCYYDKNKSIDQHIKELKEKVFNTYINKNNTEKTKLINKGIKF